MKTDRKTIIRRLLILCMLLIVSSAFAFAEDGGVQETYELLADPSGLYEGAEIVLISNDDSYYRAMSPDMGSCVVRIHEDRADVPEEASRLTLKEDEGGWILSENGKFLCAEDGVLGWTDEVENAAVWTVKTDADGAADITCGSGSICFDGSSFYCGSGGNAVSIYRSMKDHLYTVTWKDYDDSVLAVSQVGWMQLPVYPGETPEHPVESGRHFKFSGWDPEPVEATEDAVYTAQYRMLSTCGDGLWWDFDEDTGVLTVEGEGVIDSYFWPPKQPWAQYQEKVVALSLPDGLTGIGYNAFAEFSGLVSVEIPSGVKHISTLAFNNCTSLESVTLYEGIESIDSRAFKGCTSLMSFSLPDSIVKFKKSALDDTGFWNAQPDGLVYLDNVLLGSKGELAQQIIRIEDGTRMIAAEAFSDETGILRVYIPASVTTICKSAFGGCTGIKDVYFYGTKKTKAAVNTNGLGFDESLENAKWHYLPMGESASGWQLIDGSWYYLSSKGEPANGWQKIGNVWYFFDDNDIMVTGWKKISGSWYFFNPGGSMVTGWKKISGNWYYFNPGGSMATGWRTINGRTYYLKPSGVMAAGEWCQGWWLNSDGAWTYPYKGSWKQNSRGSWYEDTNGWYPRNTTCIIDDKEYTFDSRGYLVQ